MSGTTTNFSSVRNYPVQWGRWFTQQQYDSHANVVVLGLTDVKDLVGQNADGSALVGQQVLIGGSSFNVIGVFKSKGTNGFQDQDSIAVMPLTTARDTFVGNTGTVDSVTVQAKSAGRAAAAQNEVSAILIAQHPGSTSTDFSVLNQASLLQAVSTNNRTFTVLLAIVASISLLVGGIGVMNIMLVTVTERTREIGIRKAIGARQGHILTQFLVEAVLLAGIGGILGAAIAHRAERRRHDRERHARGRALLGDPRSGVRGRDGSVLRHLSREPGRQAAPDRRASLRVIGDR